MPATHSFCYDRKMAFELLTSKQLKQKLKKEGRVGLALDVDDTLGHTNPHWVTHMGEKFGKPKNMDDLMKIVRYHNLESVPHWDTPAGFKHMTRLMNAHWFQFSIPLIKDAHLSVHKINKLVPIVAYITARPDTIYKVTKKWLATHGFPDAPIVLRPDQQASLRLKNEWKADVLEELYPHVSGIIDDNPGIAEHLGAQYKGTFYLYQLHSTPRPRKNLVICNTWRDVVAAVKKRI